MGKTLVKICDNTYCSIVVVLHKKEVSCQVIGGCTFRVHKADQMIELLLLGVKTQYQRSFGVGTLIVNALKNFAYDEQMLQIVAFADWRALDFFKKQEFVKFDSEHPTYQTVDKLIHKCS